MQICDVVCSQSPSEGKRDKSRSPPLKNSKELCYSQEVGPRSRPTSPEELGNLRQQSVRKGICGRKTGKALLSQLLLRLLAFRDEHF